MPYTMKNYLNDALRTKSESFHSDKIAMFDFDAMTEHTVRSIERIDQIKKALFYGRTASWGDPNKDRLDYSPTEVAVDDDIVHAILGIVTEAGELLELLREPELATKAKMVDESGDVLWYLALLFKNLGVNFEDVAEKNINKLKVRFPDKFSEGAAMNRDDVAESAVF